MFYPFKKGGVGGGGHSFSHTEWGGGGGDTEVSDLQFPHFVGPLPFFNDHSLYYKVVPHT